MGSERTVLVVGPGAGRDEALRDTLGEPGWEVDAAGTAAEALSKLASGRYDSVVIDPALLEEPSGEAPTNWEEAVVRKPADAEELLRAAAEGAVGRRRAADEVREHAPPLDVIASSTRANLAYLDPDFNFVWVSPAYCEKSGYAEEELLGRNHFELFPHEENRAIFEQVRDTGMPFEVKEKPFVYPSQPERGVTHWDWTLTPVKDESGTVRGLVLSSVDVTERKRAEEARKLSHRLLEIANRHTQMSSLLNEFVAEVKSVSGCAAVGIRMLDEQGNIPYQAYEGFSAEFYQLESPLTVQRDACMCINVITRTTDPTLPFYTDGGSFFMNATSRFLATVSEEEKGRTRNVCNEFGYESVALVPIRRGERVLGLIHVADERENRVPAALVEVLESAALQLGTAVERVRAEEALSREAEVDAAVAELSEALMSKSSIEDISAMVLDHAQRLTGSEFGYASYIDPNTGNLVAAAMTKEIWDVCQAPNRDLVFKEFHGLWGWVLDNRKPLLTNAAADDPRSSGVPQGHVSIDRFLSVPAMAEGDLMGQLAVANPPRDYTEQDLAVAMRLASLFALAIQRERAEEALEDAALFPSENPNPVMRVAKDGTILFANRSSEDLLDSWGVQTGGRVPNYLRRSVADALKSGTSREVEIEHGDKILSFVLEPIVDNDYVNLYGRDVTRRRRAEKELAEARDTLQRLYDREHHIADVLQRAMVPEVRIEIPGYGLAARYEPALDEAAVGGDFYDVFELPDGRTGLVVGDVSGKGLKAAVHTAAAKYMLRAFAHESPDPAYVMNHLNAAMFDYTAEDAFVTVFYGVLDAKTHTLVYASGGHEPPLSYKKDIRWVLPLDVTGRAIGMFRESSYAKATLTLAPGDVLLVYTDGITDARTGDKFLGPEGLTEVLLANADRDEHGIVEAIFEAASKASEGKLRDDAAVLVLKATFDSD